MGEFIKVEIDLSKCKDMSDVDNWVQVCPVNIFKTEAIKFFPCTPGLG